MARFKIRNRKKEDRISLLPDCLLLEIISRFELSTKQVIKTTSTISKRWQHLWTKLPTLVFIYKDDVTDLPCNTYFTDYCSFIDKTLTQCPTDVNLNKFKVIIDYDSLVYTPSKSQVYSWIRHAITRNVQEVDLLIGDRKKFSYDDELLFNNSCLMSMKLSDCVFNPPNGAIRWDKLKCLGIDYGRLDKDLIGKILSGSPCLETLELKDCYVVGCIPMSLFGNFGVLERLSCKMKIYKSFSNDNELFLDDVYSMTMKFSRCAFNQPNGAIRLDKLKSLCIDQGSVDEDSIGKILSGSPCLETLELNDCYLLGRIPKSLFGNFGLLESLSCDFDTYKRFSYDDELFLNDSYPMNMKLSRCVFNPPTGAIRCDKLKFLCIMRGELDEDLIGNILSGSPFLETLQLNDCCGFRRIDVTSKSVKNLVLSGYVCPWAADYYIDTLEINAPYILSLTIKGDMYLKELLLENVSSLVKADLNYQGSYQFAEELGRDEDDIEEELLRGLLSRLGHVNEIALGDDNCLQALSRLEAKGFQFHQGSDLISCGGFLTFSAATEIFR